MTHIISRSGIESRGTSFEDVRTDGGPDIIYTDGSEEWFEKNNSFLIDRNCYISVRYGIWIPKK